MSANRFGSGIGGLMKRAWHQIPGVMGVSVMGLIGLISGIVAVNTRFAETLPPKYKMDYIVYRPDDPRAKVPVRDCLE